MFCLRLDLVYGKSLLTYAFRDSYFLIRGSVRLSIAIALPNRLPSQ